MTIPAKTRRWCFTNYELMTPAQYNEIPCKYIVVGDEVCPTTGKPHHQGYVEFENPRTLKGLKKDFPKWHLEVAKGSPSQCSDYCKKDEVILTERGQITQQGKRNDLLAVQKKIDNGVSVETIARENFGLWTRYNRSFEKYEDIVQRNKKRVVPVVTVYWGPPGTGKTTRALENGGVLAEYKSNFFNLNVGEDKIIFDEFDKWNISPELALKLLDRHPLQVNVKGGWKNVIATEIFITANLPPKRWPCFHSGLSRRIHHVIEMRDPKMEQKCLGNTDQTLITVTDETEA